MIVISKILAHPSMSAEGSRCKKDFSSSVFANVIFNNTVTIFACGPDTIFPMQIASNVRFEIFELKDYSFSRRVKRFQECGHVSVVRLEFNNLFITDIFHQIKDDFLHINGLSGRIKESVQHRESYWKASNKNCSHSSPVKTSLAQLFLETSIIKYHGVEKK